MATGIIPARRRFQRQVLRVQGRLDSSRSDQVIPWALAALIALAVGLVHAARVRSLDPTSGLAPWLQAVWRREHGGAGAAMTGVDPAQGSPISEVVLWLGRFVDPSTLFVVLQAAAIGLAVVPLWRLARQEAHLRVGASTAVIVAFALAPTLQRANLGAFHPELLAVPALIDAFRRALRAEWVRYGLLVAFVMACRADLGITVAALGAVLVSTGRRRAGTVSMVAGSAWAAAAYLVIRPSEAVTTLTPAGEFVARSTGPLAAIGDVLLHPLATVGTLVSEPSVDFLILVLAPLIFLPLMAPRRVVMAVPCLILAVVADEAVQREAARGVLDLAPAAAHIGPTIAFVFVALVFALERIGVPSVTRVNVDRRVLLSLLAGATLLFVAEAPTSPYRHPWSWGGQDAADGARLAARDLIGADETVAVSPSMSALLAERGHLVELAPDPAALTVGRAETLAAQVEVVVLDTAPDALAAGSSGLTPAWTDTARHRAEDALAAAGFHRSDAVGDILVYRRT